MWWTNQSPPLGPVGWRPYTPPEASPYPDCRKEEEKGIIEYEGKGQTETQYHEWIWNTKQKAMEITCEGLPFCSEGRLGFVKSLYIKGKKF